MKMCFNLLFAKKKNKNDREGKLNSYINISWDLHS